MLHISETARIFLFGGPIDLRNGFDGLSAAAQTAFNESISPETYFVFINNRRTHMKVLYWDGSTWAIWFVRSQNGVFTPYQVVKSIITKEEFNMILNCNTPKHLICPQNNT